MRLSGLWFIIYLYLLAVLFIGALYLMDQEYRQLEEDLINARQRLEITQMLLSKAREQLKECRKPVVVANLEAEWKVSQATITAYSPLDDKSGINSEGDPSITATGTKVGPGIFAVDPKRIPYGSWILIIYEDGTTEEGIAADTGAALRKASGIVIDVFRSTFEEATTFGRKKATIIWQPPE